MNLLYGWDFVSDIGGFPQSINDIIQGRERRKVDRESPGESHSNKETPIVGRGKRRCESTCSVAWGFGLDISGFPRSK